MKILNNKQENVTKRTRLEVGNYVKSFMMCDIREGSIASLQSGKCSYIRKKILGSPINGARMTLTIDCTMNPQYVSVPRSVYRSLDLASPLVIVNRAPSINSRCIYACEIQEHDGDDTIHVNPFLLEGLHADQDGDELNIFFLQYGESVPTKQELSAVTELRRMSWRDGLRCDVLYQPRYEFSQYHKLFCYQNDEMLMKQSPLWRSVKGSITKKLETIMHLGCSIMFDEVDDFIELLTNMITTHPVTSISCADVLTAGSELSSIATSGAKGTAAHVKIFHKALTEPCDNLEFMPLAVEKFNKIITNSTGMSDAGVQQFTMLYAFNSISQHQDKVYLNDEPLLEDFLTSDFGALLSYNRVAVNHVFDMLLSESHVGQ